MNPRLPTVCRPEAIERTVATLEAREGDLRELEQEMREARAGVESAKVEDRAEYARRRDAGEPDVGPQHLDAARTHLEDVERRLEGEQLRVQQAQAALTDALEAHIDEWMRALASSMHRADGASIRALEKLESTERGRAALRAARASLRQGRPVSAGPIPSPIKRNASGDLFSVDELLAGLRAGLENSSLARERERVLEREAAELEAETLRQQRRGLIEAVPR